MRYWFTALFPLPYENMTERDRARNVYAITVLVVILYTCFTLFGDTSLWPRFFELVPTVVFQLTAFYSIAVLTLWATGRGYLRWAAIGPALMWYFGVVWGAAFNVGLRSPVDGVTLIAIVLLAGLLNRERGVWVGSLVAFVTAVIAIGLLRDTLPVFEDRGTVANSDAFDLIAISLQILGVAGLITLFLRYADLNRQQAISQISQDRLKLAQITTRITQNVSQRVTLNEVLSAAVEQIAEQYPKVYHVQVFLVNPRGQAELVSSTGAVGQELLAKRHALTVGDKSVIGTVTASGQSILALVDDPNGVHRPNPLLPETQAEFAFPMFLGQTIVGALDLQSKLKHAFDPEDAPIFQAMADNLAIAIENARLFEEERLRRKDIEAIQHVSFKLTAINDLQQLLKTIAEVAIEVASPFEVNIFLYDSEQDRLHSGMTFRIDGQMALPRAPRQGGLAYQVAQTGEMLVVDDRRGHPLFSQNPEHWEGFLSAMGLPLRIGERVVGAMTILHPDPYGFPTSKENILRVLSEQAAVAIETARLYQAAQARAQEAETLRQAGAVIASTLDQDQAIDLIFEQLARVVPYESASVQLLREGYLELVAGRGWNERENIIGLRFAVPGDNPNTLVVRQRQPMIINDVPNCPYEGIRQYAHARFQSWLGVPLIVQDQIIGMISLDSAELNYFTPEHARLASAFAMQVALAIHNAGLYQRSQQYAEEMVQARVAAESASRSKSTFLANMSHELRTPLNAIIGYTDLLLSGLYGEISPQQQDRLKRVIDNGKHLLGLINDVLDLSKIEAGKMELYLEPFDLNEVLEGVITAVKPLAAKNGNHLNVEVPANLGQATADLTKFRQVMLNLLSNAMKFTKNGQIWFRVLEEEGRLYFSVQDTGIGIRPDQIPMLFQEFTQADPSTTREYGGTGLGLAISQRFCRMMGGDILVESVEGVGSTFTVDLPRIVVPPSQKMPEPTTFRQTSPLSPLSTQEINTVLVIDDDPTTADLMEQYLMADGYRVVKAGGGLEGVKLAKHYQPAVITLDIVMPDVDGWTVLGLLKADPDTANIPIIIVTIVDEKKTGYALGASDYLTKPIQREKMVGLLRKYSCPTPPCPVLLVEDDDEIRQLMRDTLQSEGWIILEAANGRIALEQVAQTRPAVILLDLMMPEMDGFEFLHELRAQREWRNIPVVVVTAMDLQPQDRERLNGSVQQVLQKGAYTREALLSEVRQRVRQTVRQTNVMKVVSSE
jgi:signal transduction histidine kinase/DNA-binding response OmpR family regulator